MPSGKIHDVQSLEKAIAELELKKKLLEAKLDASSEHLQKNFTSMALRSVVPSALENGPIAAAGSFFKSEKLKDGFHKLVSSVTDMASEGMESIVNRFKKKNDGAGL